MLVRQFRVSPTTWIKSTDCRELAFGSSLQAFSTQRDQLLALLADLPDRGRSRSATVLGGGRPLDFTVLSYANRLARHERTHWRQLAKTVRALLEPEPAVSGRRQWFIGEPHADRWRPERTPSQVLFSPASPAPCAA
jgi:hypothetical protein